MLPLFLDMISSNFWHSSSKACHVLGDVFLSSSSTFLCTGASAADFRKSSSFFMNGFSKNSLIFSWRFLLGIQFLGRSFLTNGVMVFCSLPFRSVIMGYVRMLGFALNQSWSGMISTLVSSVVLMSTSTTAQDLGGTLMFLFSDTDDLEGVWYSVVSAMTLLFVLIDGYWL